jgi:dipeptidase
MCDTLVALAGATLAGGRLFAKNSDRERNEAQLVELRRAARHAAGGALRLTYIAIEQAEATHACLICRPFWMWGAEMGANEHGVIIGNEAVQSIVPAARRRALTGMDLVRLGLERAASAAQALEVMTGLLERHGQGGDCGHLTRFYYHNSFLIADRREAYVLETVGRWWAAQRVERTRAISNALSIGADADAVSPDLADHATRAGWRGGDGRFDFAARLIDKAPDPATQGLSRCARASGLLAAKDGRLTAADMMTILRDHGPRGETDPDWSPWSAPHRTLCMHAGGGDRRSQTTGAMVSEARDDTDIHWVTATAAPCLSLFKPVLITSGLPDQGPAPTDRFDPATIWWRHERLHRAVLADYAPRAAGFRAERDALEARFADRIDAALAQGPLSPALTAAVAACWSEAAEAEDRWLSALVEAPAASAAKGPDATSWRRLGGRAQLPDGC